MGVSRAAGGRGVSRCDGGRRVRGGRGADLPQRPAAAAPGGDVRVRPGSVVHSDVVQPPGSTCKVVLAYACECAVEGEDIVFRLPPATKAAAHGSSPAADLRAGLSVSLSMPRAILSVTCSTHPVTLVLGDSPATGSVSLAPGASLLLGGGEGFAMGVRLERPNEPRAVLQSGVVMATFYPKLESDVVYSEMLFLVDRSGSMSGDSIESAKATLQFFLRSLPAEGTLFNVVSFGSRFERLFPLSAEYNDASLAQAASSVSSMTADMGGTDVLAPLVAIFSEPAKPGIPRQIFLLTDGRVENNEQCVRAVRENSRSTRVFTFGIGGGVDEELLRDLARAGEGHCELIRDAANMGHQVMRQLSRALQPSVTDLAMDWGALAGNVQQTPFVLPPLFNGGKIVVYGLLSSEPDAQQLLAEGRRVELSLSGTIGQQAFKSVAKVDSSSQPGTFVAKLAARSLLRDLEEGRSCMGKCSADVVETESVRISVLHGVLCKHTAFVAVERRDEAVCADGMVQRQITVHKVCGESAKTSLDAMIRAVSGSCLEISRTLEESRQTLECSIASAEATMVDLQRQGGTLSHAAAGIAPARNFYHHARRFFRGVALILARLPSCFFSFARSAAQTPASATNDALSLERRMLLDVYTPIPSNVTAAPTIAFSLQDVALSQSADGCWPASTAISLTSVTQDELAEALPPELRDKDFGLSVWATLIVVAVLSVKFPGEIAQWDLMAKKAIKWARKLVPDLSPVDSALRSFLELHHLQAER